MSQTAQKHFSLLKPEALRETSVFLLLSAVFFAPFSKAAIELFLFCGALIWLIYKAKAGKFELPNRIFLILIGLWLLSSSVSAFYSGYPAHSIRGIIKILRYSLFAVMAFDLLSNKRAFQKFIWVLLISLGLVCLDALVQQVRGADLFRQHGSVHYAGTKIRLTGPYEMFGLFGAQLIATTPIVLGYLHFYRIKEWRWWVSLACFLFFAYFLYKTHSRGAWLAQAASFFIFAFLTRNRWMAVVLVGSLLIAPFFIPRDSLIHLNNQGKEQSIVERFYLWDRAVQVIKNEPLFGCGINTYLLNYPKYDETKSWRVPGYYAHNGYLQMGAETGLVSLGLFIFLLFYVVRNGLRALKTLEPSRRFLAAGVICGFFALLFQAFVDTTLHNLQSAILIWTFLGVLAGFPYLNQEKNK